MPSADELTQTIRLLQRAKDGDQQALNDLYARFGEKLHTVVRFRLGPRLRSKMESCDVVQDALLASLRQIEAGEFASSGALFHWLVKLVENRIRDHADHFAAQKRDASRETPLDVRRASTDSVFGPIAELATFGTPSRAAVRAEDLTRLEAALDTLTPDQKEAIILVRYEGLSLTEAGEKMGRQPDAVRMLVSRAIVQLGRMVKSDDS
ncbi:MAG: RNA polymerase sigma factor [Planctomycetota bacterium]